MCVCSSGTVWERKRMLMLFFLFIFRFLFCSFSCHPTQPVRSPQRRNNKGRKKWAVARISLLFLFIYSQIIATLGCSLCFHSVFPCFFFLLFFRKFRLRLYWIKPFKIPGFRVLFMKYLLCVSVTTLNPYPFRRSYPPDVSYGIENNDHSLGKLIPTRIVGPQKT